MSLAVRGLCCSTGTKYLPVNFYREEAEKQKKAKTEDALFNANLKSRASHKQTIARGRSRAKK